MLCIVFFPLEAGGCHFAQSRLPFRFTPFHSFRFSCLLLNSIHDLFICFPSPDLPDSRFPRQRPLFQFNTATVCLCLLVCFGSSRCQQDRVVVVVLSLLACWFFWAASGVRPFFCRWWSATRRKHGWRISITIKALLYRYNSSLVVHPSF